MFTAAAHRLATDDTLIHDKLAYALPDFGRYEKLPVPHSRNTQPHPTRASQTPNSAPVKFLFSVFTLIPSRYRTEAFPPSCQRVQVFLPAFTVFHNNLVLRLSLPAELLEDTDAVILDIDDTLRIEQTQTSASPRQHRHHG
jgi:hypothetical protein